MSLFFTVLTILVVGIQVVNHYAYGSGNLRLSYSLSMLAFTGYIVIETALALNSPEQISVLLFNVINVWGFLNAFRGLRRLKREHE